MMCECERKLALTFLPHQVDFASEYGSRRRIPVDGFTPRICAECRGVAEEAHPLAEIWGQKGKVERFYWRDIFKTYCELLVEYYGPDFHFGNVVERDSQFPEIAKRLNKKARKYWQEIHEKAPKYDVKEDTEAEFLAEVPVPIRHIEGDYIQIERQDQKIGKWLNRVGELVSVEDLVTEYYHSQGYEVLRSERRLISAWVATFLGMPIQDPSDPRTQQVMRGSTKAWTSRNQNTAKIYFNLPEDFGSPYYYQRRRVVIDSWLLGMRIATNLVSLFDTLLEETELIRDYLWVADDKVGALARQALRVLPQELVITCVKWAIEDFWGRQSGWPDLVVISEDKFLFAEVKSPHDKLSQDQMRWFRWAVTEAAIPCEIVKVRRKHR
jgi:hypothetical protein